MEATWINLDRVKATQNSESMWLFVSGSPGYIEILLYRYHINLSKDFVQVHWDRCNPDWGRLESLPLNLLTVLHSEVGEGGGH